MKWIFVQMPQLWQKLKWKLSVKPETTQILEGSTEESLCDLGLSMGFLEMRQKRDPEKNQKLNFLFCL